MREKDYDGECRSCGYSDRSINLASYLSPKTFLEDRYIIGRLLSYNGEGAVYLAYDTVDEKTVNIREYMPDTLCMRDRDEEVIRVRSDSLPLYKSYLSEFMDLYKMLMSSAESTCIQAVLNTFTANNTAYVVLESINGISLKTYLANCGNVLTWEQAKELFPPLFTTLGIIHRLGIVHRGISPTTIFITDKMQLKLVDFSICAARTVDSNIDCEVYSGYASPEQYSSLERHGSWTDVFGICAVLYRVLTGNIPADAQSRAENDTLIEPMMINRNIPAGVSATIMKGLTIDHERRIHTVNELVTGLFEQPRADGGAIKPRTERKAPTASKKPVKKEKAKSNAGSVIVLSMFGMVVIAFVVLIIYFSGRPEQPVVQSGTTTETSAPQTSAPTETTTKITTTKLDSIYILPDFRGRMYDTMADKYTYLSFTPEAEYNDTYDKGMIFEQSIEPNTEVTSGTSLVVKVSKGPAIVALPDYKGKTLEEYKAVLTDDYGIAYELQPLKNNKKELNTIVGCSKPVGAEINVADGEIVIVYFISKEKGIPKEESVFPTATTIAAEGEGVVTGGFGGNAWGEETDTTVPDMEGVPAVE